MEVVNLVPGGEGSHQEIYTKNAKRLTKKEIIEDTVNWYSEDHKRRGVTYSASGNQNGCLYVTGDGNKCAVGRYLAEKHSYFGIDDIITEAWGSSNVGDINEKSLDLMLIKEARGHSGEFWEQLQGFHDSEEYWSETGLTTGGKKQFKWLLTYYEEDPNDK